MRESLQPSGGIPYKNETNFVLIFPRRKNVGGLGYAVTIYHLYVKQNSQKFAVVYRQVSQNRDGPPKTDSTVSTSEPIFVTSYNTYNSVTSTLTFVDDEMLDPGGVGWGQIFYATQHALLKQNGEYHGVVKTKRYPLLWKKTTRFCKLGPKTTKSAKAVNITCFQTHKMTKTMESGNIYIVKDRTIFAEPKIWLDSS
jgi:hypothetical protein